MSSIRSQRSRAYGAFDYSSTKHAINFAYGMPDPETFPSVPLPPSLLPQTGVGLSDLLQYTDSQGLPELRRQLAERYDVSPEHTLVTGGASQALTLLADLLINPGDIVLTEDPGYLGALRIFSVAGANVIQLGMDCHGVHIAALEQALEQANGKVALYYTSPVYHNPTGCCFSVDRMSGVAELLKRHGVPLIQDLVYAELPYQTPEPEVMKAGDNVINIHSFSKIAGAGLRVGWVIAEPGIVQVLALLKSDGGVSPLVSNVVLEVLRSDALRSHILDLREHYRAKRDLMARVLQTCTFCDQDYVLPMGGFSFWVRIVEGVDPLALIDKVRLESNVHLVSGAKSGPGSQRYVRLCFSYLSDTQIEFGIQRIEQSYRALIA